MNAPYKCGGYYCCEEIGHIDCGLNRDGTAKTHDHQCNCGTATHAPHETGTLGCVRSMVEAPKPAGLHDWLKCQMWKVDGHTITDTSLRDQRGYWQHPCGCWSRSPGSTNSVKA